MVTYRDGSRRDAEQGGHGLHVVLLDAAQQEHLPVDLREAVQRIPYGVDPFVLEDFTDDGGGGGRKQVAVLGALAPGAVQNLALDVLALEVVVDVEQGLAEKTQQDRGHAARLRFDLRQFGKGGAPDVLDEILGIDHPGQLAEAVSGLREERRAEAPDDPGDALGSALDGLAHVDGGWVAHADFVRRLGQSVPGWRATGSGVLRHAGTEKKRHRGGKAASSGDMERAAKENRPMNASFQNRQPIPDGESVVAAFLQQFLDDRRACQIRPVEDYQRMFPGYEERIAREHGVLMDGEPVALQPGAPLAVPGDVGPYRLVRELGRGGQCVVYLAEDRRLGDRQVALKVLSGLGAFSEPLRTRFLREAAHCARLDHPAICAVYEVGEERGIQYIAMRYVSGETVADRLRRAREGEPWPWEVVAELFEKVARALHLAHERGLLHRDIKPGNIIVDEQGEPVLLDFGLALDLAVNHHTLTETGQLLGTPAYMSPEQIALRRKEIDRRSDLYSMGVTLYECLTLCRPFDAESREVLYRKILEEEPPIPRKDSPPLPRDLWTILGRCLEKDPERRFTGCLELAEELARVRRHEPIRTRQRLPAVRFYRTLARRPRWIFVPAAILVGVVLMATLYARQVAVRVARERAMVAQYEAMDREMEAREEFTRLTDMQRLRDLESRVSDLWPAAPQKVAEMERWLEESHDLVSREEDYRRHLRHFENIAAEHTPPGFDDPADAWKYDQLQDHVGRLDRFLAPGDGWIATVEQRIEQAKSAASSSSREAWRRVFQDVADSPRYGGLRLNPQSGLVPLGAQPSTGLQEFAVLGSGMVPERLADGTLGEDGATAILLVLLPPSDEAGALLVSRRAVTRAQLTRLAGPGAEDPDFAGPGPIDNILRRAGLRLPTTAEWERVQGQGSSASFTATTSVLSFHAVRDVEK